MLCFMAQSYITDVPMAILKIFSGGQTGADRGGFEAALRGGVLHGGWCPKGRKAEDGRIPACYTLRETDTETYPQRTERNIVDSDATLVFTRGAPAGGSLLTLELARRYGKPWYAVDLTRGSREEHVAGIFAWLRGKAADDDGTSWGQPQDNCVLNVAGSRESENPGIESTVTALMCALIASIKQ
ncbi:MAG: putative molybdenum carrier [Candidatus Hydrogenedentes bacterium ADurb.Bin101]|nr:MAG: putative molybdenum carrier [Candidatus Hydrogenedentes bacterium ADurb.Bin101]